jgi:hypothetical protein
MPRMKTYILHATYRYVTKQKETGETYSAQSRPTLSIKASSQKAAENKAIKQCRERISTDWWPVVSDSLVVELARVVD